LRGCKRTFTDAHIAFVCQEWKAYSAEREKVKIEAFAKHLRRQWKAQPWEVTPPSRKTVEDMLKGNGLREKKAKKSRSASSQKGHTEKVKRHFPGAQALLDGKEVLVSFLGQTFEFVLEFCQDMATGTIGGSAIGDTETAKLVKEATDDFCQTHQKPLATLQDNGSGNQKAALDFGADGILVIRAHPYRPETKGLIEGEFGLFEKKVSTIKITGETTKEIAQSVLENIVAVYTRLRNQTPRCSVCPFTPQEMMNYKPGENEKQQAYDQLKEASERKAKQKEQGMKVSQEFHELVDSIIKEHRLEGDSLRLKQSLKYTELSIIREAEKQFAVQSKRDIFDEAKRTMAYFAAIARNMQDKKDEKRRLNTAQRRYALDQVSRQKRAAIEAQLAQQREQSEFEKQPEKLLVSILQSEMNLPQAFRARSTLHKERLNEALEALVKRNNHVQLQRHIQRTEEAIMRLGSYPLNLRNEMVTMIHQYLNNLP